MTETMPDPTRDQPIRGADRLLVVIPRIHDSTSARTLYGLVPVTGGGWITLSLLAGPVDDPEELRAGAALLLARRIGEGMSTAVIAPLGCLYADENRQHRIDVMLAVARRPEAEQAVAFEHEPVQWLTEVELLRAVSSGQILGTTTYSAIALLLACGELVR